MVVQQPGYHLQQEVVGVDMVQSHVTKRSVTKLLELHVQIQSCLIHVTRHMLAGSGEWTKILLDILTSSLNVI